MAGDRDASPTDYVVLALSPALLMALVGSLVFFLLEVLYAGEYSGRLQWILFFYVFGAVLTARVSMQADSSARAGLYGAALGLLTFLGLQFYVDYPPNAPMTAFAWLINLCLIGLIWWCSWQLTWDCTYLDENVGSNGQGVLQAAGLETPEGAEEEAKKPKKLKPGFNAWLERLQKFWSKRQKNRTAGVWVIYFSLAALPLFGLGQALIPSEAVARRQYTFWLMVLYVGSGLGLLVTTSFLGLRNHLRQRGLTMPASMTGLWLSVGAGLIVLFLAVGALLPRPSSEYRPFSFTPIGSKERQANRVAPPGEEAGKDDGMRGQKQEKDGNTPNQKDRDSAGGKDQRKDGQNPQKDRGEQGQKDSKPQDKQAQDKQARDKQTQDKPPQDKQARDKQAKDGDDRQAERDADNPSREASTPPAAPEWLGKVASVLKWVVFAVLALLVGFFVLRSLLQFLANFTGWARSLLAFFGLLFGQKEKGKAGALSEEEQAAELAAPFAAYSNPFEDGRAPSMSEQELIRYTFAALEAWARERDQGRRPGETALEFTRRLAEELPPFETELQRLAQLQARIEYAPGNPPANTAAILEQFWDRLQRVDAQPLSA